MSYRAWMYIWAILLVGLGLTVVSTWMTPFTAEQSLTFFVLATLATVAHLFEAEAPGRASYYPSYVFFFAGVLLLSPFYFALLIVVPHAAELIKDRIVGSNLRRAWYVQPFNVSMHIIAGAAAHWIYEWLQGDRMVVITASPVFLGTVAVLTYLVLNRLLIGFALILARGVSWRESGLLGFESLIPEFILASLGYVVAFLWQVNPWFVLPAISPLVLVYRALMVPQLKQEAQTDAKTGLFNARYFNKMFSEELGRAQRFGRPLALIMADLDLMREINNTYGHLAGDAVLAGIGQIIRSTIREYDVPGRFGGEEFAIALPEVGAHEARLLAERLRCAIQAAEFRVETSPTPIRATMSIGVACFPQDGTTELALTHSADIAVYQAKAIGRNRVVLAADVPLEIKQNYETKESTSSAHTA